MSFDKQMWDGLFRKLGGMVMHSHEDGHHIQRRTDCFDDEIDGGGRHYRRSSSLGSQFPIQHEPLKDASASLDSSTSSSSSSRRSIQFDNMVSVVRIPSHTSYSIDDKKHMWSTDYETRENARRNRREFAAEQYDWKQCVEEDEMYYDRISCEYIHPIHLNRYIMGE